MFCEGESSLLWIRSDQQDEDFMEGGKSERSFTVYLLLKMEFSLFRNTGKQRLFTSLFSLQ